MAEKIGYLDSLRGIAALVVVFTHFSGSFFSDFIHDLHLSYRTGFESLIYTLTINNLFNGRFAVFIFFVLSGYVLTHRFFATGDQSILSSSAIRRYFRLLPPILLSLACSFGILLVFLPLIGSLAEITDQVWLFNYFDRPLDPMSLLRQAFWGSFFDSSPVYNMVLWTMGVEFLGSMLVFAFACLFGKTRNRWAFYLVAGLFLLNTYYLAFLLGMLLADMYAGARRKTFTIDNSAILLAIFGSGLFLGSYDTVSFGWLYSALTLGLGFDQDILFRSLGAFFILLALLNSGTFKLLLSNKLMAFLGSISFSMYLMHMIVIGTFTTVLLLVLLDIIHLSYFESLVIAIPLSLVAILFVSYLTYRYVDLSGIKLSKKIYDTYFTYRPGREQKPLDFATIKNRVISYTKKNLYLIVALQLILLIIAAGTVVFIKPTLDQNSHLNTIAKAKSDYLYYEAGTIASYQDLATYSNKKVNFSSIGHYKEWVDGYKSLTENLTYNYDQMNETGILYES